MTETNELNTDYLPSQVMQSHYGKNSHGIHYLNSSYFSLPHILARYVTHKARTGKKYSQKDNFSNIQSKRKFRYLLNINKHNHTTSSKKTRNDTTLHMLSSSVKQLNPTNIQNKSPIQLHDSNH